MKKSWIMGVLLILGCVPASRAQSFSEWFRQKKTQKRYLTQQIAALKVYSDYLNKGYGIIKEGTGLISAATGSEFGLHRNYFGSLKTVNPAIRENSRTADILRLHTAMITEGKRILNRIMSSSFFNEREKRYIRSFYDRLHEDAANDIDELMQVVTDGKLELSDAQRINRIAVLYTAMENKTSIHRKISDNLNRMLEMKSLKETDITILLRLYGIDH